MLLGYFFSTHKSSFLALLKQRFSLMVSDILFLMIWPGVGKCAKIDFYA